MPEPADIRWHRDELVLVLDLYLRHGASPDGSHVSKLSRELRGLHVHPVDGRPANFRSSDAVVMMLGRFDALATRQPTGRGGSPLAAEVWAEFAQPGGFGRDRRRVWEAAREVRDRDAASGDSEPAS